MRRTVFRPWEMLVLIGLLVPSSLGAAIVPHDADYETIHTPHFRVHCLKSYQTTCLTVARYMEEAHATLGKAFGLKPLGKVEVVVTDQHDIANGSATVVPYNLIVLRLVPPDAENQLAYYDDWLRLLINHEYLHVLHLSDASYPAKFLKFIFGKVIAPNALSPSWVIEGLATYYESATTGMGRGYSSFADMVLRTDIINDDFLKLDQMAGSMSEWPSYRAGYLYGVGFWNYLAKIYGHEKLAEFSHKYGASLWFFSLNNKARVVFGKYFTTLWKEWRDSLRTQYQGLESHIDQLGLEKGTVLIADKKSQLSNPAWSPDGEKLAYVSTSTHHQPELRLWTPDSDRVLLKEYIPDQISWSADGKQLAFTAIRRHKKYNLYKDLFLYDLEEKQLKTITRGQRVRDAAFGPDDRLVAVSIYQDGRDRLALYDLENEELSIGEETPPNTRIDSLDWSPAGDGIVASVWRKGGYREIVVFDSSGKIRRTITKTRAMNIQPKYSFDGRFIYYSSDQSGIYNLYRYDQKTRQTRQLTRVMSGAFFPAPAPDGESLVFQYYTGRGYEIRQLTIAPLAVTDRTRYPDLNELPKQAEIATTPTSLGDSDFQIKPYSPLSPALLPHYAIPGLTFLDDALFLSLSLASTDALFRHAWYGNVTYRTDNNFLGYGAGYTYARYLPIFIGFREYSVKFSNLFGVGSNFFERRRRGFAGVSIRPGGGHVLSTQYFFENRGADTAVPSDATVQPTLGNFAGFRVNYLWNQAKQLPAMISPENGFTLRATADASDHFFGASEDMEQVALSADLREYLELPWADHHVLAFRQGGGVAIGDQFTQGSFALGGSLGESRLFQASQRVYTLRGIPFASVVRERVLVFSAEYRMPLFQAQRGPGTWPLFLRQGSLRFFADYGNAWNEGEFSGIGQLFDNFLLGVGAELVGHFVLAYHLPVIGRLGYGIIVVNRDRVVNLTDPILGQSVTNGILILELGTSF